MKKRLMINLTVLCLLLAALSLAVSAAETTEPGEAAVETTTETVTETTQARPSNACGEDLIWNIEGNTLTISGNGPMDDCTGGAPWADYRDSIQKVVLSGNVTSIGAEAFLDYDSLTEVDFGNSLIEIDTRAFSSCDGLTSITLPSTFRRFGEESFRSCRNLKEIHCLGSMPSFNLNCLWDSWVTIYFPAERPWPLEHIEQLETAFQGRIEFLASDGSDPYDPTQPKETQPEQTQPQETKPTEPEATEPATTAPVTIPATEEPETQPTVTEESAASEPEETIQATQEPTESPDASKSGSMAWIGIVLIVVVLSAGILGALIFRRHNSRGGKYSARR